MGSRELRRGNTFPRHREASGSALTSRRLLLMLPDNEECRGVECTIHSMTLAAGQLNRWPTYEFTELCWVSFEFKASLASLSECRLWQQSGTEWRGTALPACTWCIRISPPSNDMRAVCVFRFQTWQRGLIIIHPLAQVASDLMQVAECEKNSASYPTSSPCYLASVKLVRYCTRHLHGNGPCILASLLKVL